MGQENNIHSSQETTHPDIHIEIFPVTDLLNPSRQALLYNINDLLNDAYIITDSAAKQTSHAPEPIFTRPRIQQTDQLVQELGVDGLIAVCTDNTLPRNSPTTAIVNGEWEIKINEPYFPGKYGSLVATAAIAKWKGRVVENFKLAMQEAQQLKGDVEQKNLQLLDHQAQTFKDSDGGKWNWEVKTCASCDAPKYRGKGLITQCVDALVQQLLVRQAVLNENGEDMNGRPRLKLWITALEGSNNPIYWAKRGFVRDGEIDIAPKGLWGSNREFMIQTLSKVIP